MAERRRLAFAGPSLYGLDVAVDVGWRPPIRCGDLLSVPGIEEGRWSIAIIDGEFGQSLAVTVTEIRQALEWGNRIVGGASMGALRAVECAPLGMEGVGWIVERYRDGTLFSDAEVALTYDPASYRPFTVPMVNVRWLSRLIAGRDGDAGHAELTERAAAVPFARRDLGTLRALANECLPPEAAAAWLRELREDGL